MTKLIVAARRLIIDRKGVTALEYGLIAALIAVAIIGAVETLGGGLSSTFNAITAKLPAS